MLRKITASDLRGASGYDAGGLRAVLDHLQSVSCLPSPKKARAAIVYSRLDVSLVAVMYELDTKFGLRKAAMPRIGPAVRDALARPRDVNPDARLVVTIDPPTVRYLEKPEPVDIGIVMPLRPVFTKVDGYLGLSLGAVASLPLTPGAVRKRRRNEGRS